MYEVCPPLLGDITIFLYDALIRGKPVPSECEQLR